jgi:predicted NBD/HSP70 family sugar kinase
VRVGLDIGGTKTDGIVLDGSGAVVHSLRMPTGWGEDAVLATAKSAVTRLADEAGVAAHAFESIGIGIPGKVDTETGAVSHALNLGVESLALGELLSDHFGAAVRVENDVNAAALGAFHELGLPPTASMAYLNLGTGLAAGLVLRGELWRGSRGAAGEIGQILVDPNGPLDSNEERGSLEATASGSGIARQWPNDGTNPVRDMLAAADAGDPAAVELRGRFFWGVATAVRVLVLTVDVEVVVIGGGISVLGDVLLSGIAEPVAGWEAQSSFISSLGLVGRLRLLSQETPTAATGAALLGGSPWQR